MKTWTPQRTARRRIDGRSDEERLVDASALVGIAVGMGLLLPAFVAPEMGLLAVPAFLVLLPSLLFGMR